MRGASTPIASLPVVIVPLGTDEDALDACLAALDAGTPAGTRVWLADNAQTGPRALAIVERWLARTPLQAAHTRRSAPIGEAAHLDDALRACADADVAILASDARPTPGWLGQLASGRSLNYRPYRQGEHSRYSGHTVRRQRQRIL